MFIRRFLSLLSVVGAMCCVHHSHRIFAKISVERIWQGWAVFSKFASYEFSGATELGSYSWPISVITSGEKKENLLIPIDETASHSGPSGNCEWQGCGHFWLRFDILDAMA
jgi:hypothetical protein